MDVTGTLLCTAGDQLPSAAWLASLGHSEVEVSPAAAFDGFTPPVFLLRVATPALPGPALTAPYTALHETARKMSARFPFESAVFSSSRAEYQDHLGKEATRKKFSWSDRSSYLRGKQNEYAISKKTYACIRRSGADRIRFRITCPNMVRFIYRHGGRIYAHVPEPIR